MWKYSSPPVLWVGIVLVLAVAPDGSEPVRVGEEPDPALTTSVALHQAIANGALETVRTLLAQGADLNAKESGMAPLHRAVLHGHEDIALLLIGRGADVNARDKEGKTPLHYAVWQNQITVAEALLSRNADAHAVDNYGMTVLAAAGYSKSDSPTSSVEPGMVVCIDTKNEGSLALCREAYDRKVVGIISGAGGIGTGMHLGKRNSKATGEQPVALAGRVYCWADAGVAPIKPGDFLTTSNTPGHAMKAVDFERAQGAIIGKAMTPLEKGRGMVLVFVTLQ